MGGMERASVNLANALNEEGYKVYFIVILKKQHFFDLNANITLIEPNLFNINSISLLKTITYLRKNIKTINPDSTLVFGQFYGALSMLATFGFKNKIYLSERSSPFYVWPLSQRIINKFCFSIKKPDGLIAQTSIAKKYQQLYYGKNVKIEVIHNQVREINYFPDIKREKIILAVGRFNDISKGFDLLIQSFALVKNEDWRLVFAGGDENGQHLRNIASNYNVLHRIDFLGKVLRIDEVYAKASIFVIPSRSEGFPNALCEAMAAGLPCISFDFVAGPRDIIDNGKNGIIVEFGNLEKLAEEIDLLISNEELRFKLGANAKFISDTLGKKNITKKIIDFIL